jgi:hypothetical protein
VATGRRRPSFFSVRRRVAELLPPLLPVALLNLVVNSVLLQCWLRTWCVGVLSLSRRLSICTFSLFTRLAIVRVLFVRRVGRHFQPAFVLSAQSEWCYPCYTCFYLRIVYDDHCKLSSQITKGGRYRYGKPAGSVSMRLGSDAELSDILGVDLTWCLFTYCSPDQIVIYCMLMFRLQHVTRSASYVSERARFTS